MPNANGVAKKLAVVETLKAKFADPKETFWAPKKKTLLEKVFGGLETAVEKAFQVSNLALTVKKIF